MRRTCPGHHVTSPLRSRRRDGASPLTSPLATGTLARRRGRQPMSTGYCGRMVSLVSVLLILCSTSTLRAQPVVAPPCGGATEVTGTVPDGPNAGTPEIEINGNPDTVMTSSEINPDGSFVIMLPVGLTPGDSVVVRIGLSASEAVSVGAPCAAVEADGASGTNVSAEPSTRRTPKLAVKRPPMMNVPTLVPQPISAEPLTTSPRTSCARTSILKTPAGRTFGTSLVSTSSSGLPETRPQRRL